MTKTKPTQCIASRIVARVGAALVTVGLLFGASTAYAEPKVTFTVRPIDPVKDPKRKGLPPDIEATVIDGPGGVPADKFTLIQKDSKAPIPPMKALSLKSYIQGPDAIALVVLIEGQQIWIGTDKVEVDPQTQTAVPESEKYAGALEHLLTALEPLTKAGPPGSLGAIMTYNDKVDIRQPMGPLANLSGANLGTQKDYFGKQTTNLTSGVTEALAQLRKVPTPRKALLIIGSGTDTAPDQARVALKELKKQADTDRVELYGFTYQPAILPEPDSIVLPILIPATKPANSGDTIRNEISGVVSRISNRFYVVFPGYDPKLKAGFTWDGAEHELEVQVDNKEIAGIEPATVVLTPVWKTKSGGGFPWLAVLIPIGGLLLIMLGVKVFSRKPAVELPPPPMVQMEAPKPMTSAGKTAMWNIGNGSDADGFPIVGWLVPLNGANQFQTFKLQQGATKIGTAPPSNIVVNDGFMSTDHCQIMCSPQGFQLQDNKSTNGCYVNDRRVDRHDLVDNDMITLGKTNFKFKSIS
jgi:Inner membrane component of T3SS, cytoplasmic domain